ncbi:MAG TPA: folylpolyglutamate synthase/dihydrofolate synthase family protein [Kiloniellales bacterium]|nr:folylpolyglutamate synthase/dihydrofolate synthase family protein [Kiloniellales bacterium]
MARPTAAAAAATPDPIPAAPRSDAVLDRVSRLHPKIIDLSLGRIERLLERLGHPERALAPVVHVAGTNGKGSVIAFLRAMLEAAGRRVQVYSSPHLVRFHERIRLTDGLIEEPELIAHLEACEAANGPEPITFFEITTAAAFLAFAREPADILLLETGLGGRLDATNVIARPRLTAITPISIDHVQFLGDTIEKIAFEKAGILKPGVPAVIAPQPPEAAAVIAARAAEIGAPLSRAGIDWSFAEDGDHLRFESTANGTRLFPAPNLIGPHQFENAATALACAERLGDFGLDSGAMAAGLTRADWTARLQRLTQGPLPAQLPQGWELWLDGGHNAAAGTALARTLAAWHDRPLDLIYGMLNTKAGQDYLRPLAPYVRRLRAIAVPGETASLSAEASAANAAAVGISAAPSPSPAEALAELTSGPGPARVLICGSLYLAGRILADNG